MNASLGRECAGVRDDLSEFALGILAGRDRSRVLDHVATCSSCHHEIESLAALADSLVELAPSAEAPVGFESRLLERYHSQHRRRQRPKGRLLALTGAALLLVASGFALGGLSSRRPDTSSSAAPLSANLTSQGRNVGQVWVSSETPAWIYMSLDDANWSGTAWCRVTLRGGRILDVGAFSVNHGYGAWAAHLDVARTALASAQVTDGSGRVLASVSLST